MQATVVFGVVAVLALLVPVTLAVALIKLTVIERPQGYYRNHLCLLLSAALTLFACNHMVRQIVSGEIYFKPIMAKTALSASMDAEPAQFLLMSAFYVGLCGALLMAVSKLYVELKAFRKRS